MNSINKFFISVLFILSLFFGLYAKIFADITDYNSSRYNSLISTYGISNSYNQGRYLNEFIEGSRTSYFQLQLPSDSNIETIIGTLYNPSVDLNSLKSNTDLWLSKIDSGIIVLNQMSSYMKPADEGGIGFLTGCIIDITIQFTTDGVYCSNTKFLRDMTNVEIALLNKADKIIRLQKSIEFAILSRVFITDSIIHTNGSNFFVGGCSNNQYITGISSRGVISCSSNQISDVTDSTSSDIQASSKAAKTAYDKGQEALDSTNNRFNRVDDGNCPYGIRSIGNDGTITCASFVIENRTSDPSSPSVGQIWLRTDL